jgi:hypothetical protein
MVALLLCAALAAHGKNAGTTSFILDGNRVYAELDFVRPDGSIHRALAFVDMGSPEFDIRGPLYDELQLQDGRPLRLTLGGLAIEVPAKNTVRDPAKPRPLGPELKVEATLPASILQRYQVVVDYKRRTFTLAAPGTIKERGPSLPFQLDKETGLIAVEAMIEGHTYQITIDNGSAYTWLSQDVAQEWVKAHPEWRHGIGAVGLSNMMMSGDRTETAGWLLRLPEIALGPLVLKNVGVLAAGADRDFPGNLSLFEWYSQKNAVPVIGWIGGNVLKSFRLIIDYPERRMYWIREADLEQHELDTVGLTLRYDNGDFIVAGIATKDARATVSGVVPGDKLILVGSLAMRGATWGAVYNALHGKPYEKKKIVLERNGRRITVSVAVTPF